MNTHELVALDSELKNESHDIDTIEEMKQLARKEIYARIAQNERDEILEILAQSLKARLGSVLNNEETAPYFFEILQDAAKGNPPRAYRNILKEFFLAHTDAIMALDSHPEQFRILNSAIYSISVSIKILQETLDKASSADKFLAAFDASTVLPPTRAYQNALKKFFTANTEKLEKLLSTEQIEVIDFYINRVLSNDAKEMAMKGQNATSTTKNTWVYIRYAIEIEQYTYKKGIGAHLLINFLKTWPQYLDFVDQGTGDNLLHLVAKYGGRKTSKEIGAFLLNAGLELEAQNKVGETALFIIGKRDMFSPLFDYLKEQGAKINATDLNGNTILHHLLYQGFPPSPHIEKAIGFGISPYQKNNEGLTPIMLSEKDLLDHPGRQYHYYPKSPHGNPYYGRTEKMKRFWQQYGEENDDIPIDDSLHLPPVAEKEEVPTKASRCYNFVLALLKHHEGDRFIKVSGKRKRALWQ